MELHHDFIPKLDIEPPVKIKLPPTGGSYVYRPLREIILKLLFSFESKR
jgi:hypothetical protein